MRLPGIAAAGVAAALYTMPPRHADACSWPPPSIGPTQPADGDTDVPLNATITVYTSSVDLLSLRITGGAGGEVGPIRLATRCIVAVGGGGELCRGIHVPESELAPETRYEVEVSAGSEIPAQRFTFTTGMAVAAPLEGTPRLELLGVRLLPPLPSAEACGDASTVAFRFGVEPVPVEPPGYGRLEIERVGTNGGASDPVALLALAAHPELELRDEAPPTQCYRLVQYDAAGRRGAESEPACGEALPTPAPSGEVSSSPPASATGCAQSGSAAPVAALLTAALIALRGRRTGPGTGTARP